MNLIWIFLPLIIALGAITSYEDIKEGKIRNKWVITALILSFITHVTIYSFQIINLNYIIKISIFIFFSLIIGFFLYIMGLWSAGDAKLFTAFTALVPLTTYKHITTSFWPLAILVNTFVPIFLFLLVVMLFKSTWKQKFLILKNILHPRRVGQYLLVIFSIGWITTLIFNYFGIEANLILNIIAIMGINAFLRKVYPYEFNYLLGLVSLLRVLINRDLISTFSFWKIFLFMTLIYMVILVFITELSRIFVTPANINFLKEGVIPKEGILKKGEYYFKTALSDFSLFKENKNLVYQPKVEGLNKKDIKKIQKLHRTGKLHFNHIKIQQTLPFAVFMFFGVLMALLIRGNFVLWVRTLF